MKLMGHDIRDPMALFYVEHGVDIPRAFSRWMREESCVNDRRRRPFAEFLKVEFTVQYTAWRIITGEK